MGAIRTTPQVDQNGQESGQISIEITYGGKESPFGGIDASMPPAYIMPNCFASSDGFLVIDNKLVLVSFQQITLPTLFSGTSDVTLLKIGNFYISTLGYINYALGVNTNTTLSNPDGRIYTFYMTAWKNVGGINTILGNDVLTIKAFNVVQAAVAASLTVPLQQGESAGFTDSGTVTLNAYNSTIPTTNISQGYVLGDTIQTILSSFITAANAVTATTLFSAAPSPDGLGITFTANTPGLAGNNLSINDVSTSTTVGNTPAFYFPLGFSPSTNLEGGKDAFTIIVPSSFSHSSVTEVGGIAYFANLGPFILKYGGPGFFDISSNYAGYKYISKFAGSLIGLSVIPALLNIVQNSDMIFAWSAANNLDIWSPVDANGNVTGAGFAQLADIESPLVGLIVTNNTAFIIRSQGVSYATALGSGADPFSFQHISLSDEGEGAQNARLICQYNQTGAYIGNSDVFEINGSLGSIGTKINSLILPALQISNGPVDSTACAVTIGGKTFPIVGFMVDSTIYFYNPDNKTWMTSTFGNPIGITVNNAYLEITTFYSQFDSVQRRAQFNLVFEGTNSGTETQADYALIEGYNGSSLINVSNIPQIVFPQEELLFGRDVTINSIYLSMNANTNIGPGVTTLIFSFNGVPFSLMQLDPGDWNNVNGNPIEIQVYPTTMNVFTAHSPQLSIQVISSHQTLLRFTKIQVYGSFDPNQKPVS